jgi:ketosteroid isomerase-like protein
LRPWYLDPKQIRSAVEIGKMVEVFRKQPDGSWKAFVDIFSPDTAPAPTPAKS